VLTAISAGAPQAQAGLRFCNQGKFPFKAAVGYANEKKAWVARGWLTIEPGECKDALGYPLDNRFYYYFARGHDENERIKYTGDHPFCIESRGFKLPQATYGKATEEECAKEGLRSVGFKKVDVQGKPEFTINLGGADNPPDEPETPTQAAVPPPAAQQPPAAAVQQPPAAAAPPSAMADPSMPPSRRQPQRYQQEQPGATADPSMDPPQRRRQRYPDEQSGGRQQPGATADPSMDPPRRRPRYNQEDPAPPSAQQQQPAPPAAQGGAPNGAACQRFPNLC
jgi:uncharacterized membrane protein